MLLDDVALGLITVEVSSIPNRLRSSFSSVNCLLRESLEFINLSERYCIQQQPELDSFPI